ncbi:Lacal_2735 family protein [Mariniflexile litorale]|uniref:Lacal_2735 family protein n=1 Tax=Mariniflexile litorale TaxID=3045158 RepID=A0AAU7EBA8_9FLAO|nr:Lacal_2735 family protein [Mariniflexile sp. KMM 9835]MDQ8212635.1 Lacal_2735 family protein [Mariniflexile sp. KMM 9835]
MSANDIITNRQKKLDEQYKELMEQAYNFRQTDSELSDVAEFRAMRLLNKLNTLRYFSRNQVKF